MKDKEENIVYNNERGIEVLRTEITKMSTSIMVSMKSLELGIKEVHNRISHEVALSEKDKKEIRDDIKVLKDFKKSTETRDKRVLVSIVVALATLFWNKLTSAFSIVFP